MSIQSNKILAWVNIIGILFLFLDSFILKPRRELEIFDHYQTTETLYSETATHSYYTNTIFTKSGKKLREPNNFKLIFEPGDTFYVERSSWLRRPIRFIYNSNNKIISTNSGVLNQGYFGVTIAVLIFGFSIIAIITKAFSQRPNLKQRLLFCATSFLIVMLFMYFT